MQVGTTKDQGLYNKPSAAVHSGALAVGTLPQYNRLCFTTRAKFEYMLFYSNSHKNHEAEKASEVIKKNR